MERASHVSGGSKHSIGQSPPTYVGGSLNRLAQPARSAGSLTNVGPDHMLRVPRIVNFNERPAAETAVVVDGRDPQRARGCHLGRLIFLFLAGDFDQQVQEVVHAVAIVKAGQEVRKILPFLAVQRVRDRKTQVIVFDVAYHLGHVVF